MDAKDIVEQIKKYDEAVAADRYRVTSVLMMAGDKKSMVLDRDKDGKSQGFAISELLDRVYEMKRLESRGENLYLTPLSINKHHILVDDLTIERLKKLIDDGYKPCAIIESSPHNYQAIITVDKLGVDRDKDIGNAISSELNRLYGDPKLSGAIHPHRAPGFANQKPKHRRPDGSYPVVKLLKSENRQCEKTYLLAKNIEKNLKELVEKNRARRGVTILNTTITSADQAYIRHYNNIISHQSWLDDYSRLDAMIAIRLRATGHTQAEIVMAIKQQASLVRPIDKQDKNWDYYATKTANYAFSVKGDREIFKNQNYIKIWQRIESS